MCPLYGLDDMAWRKNRFLFQPQEHTEIKNLRNLKIMFNPYWSKKLRCNWEISVLLALS